MSNLRRIMQQELEAIDRRMEHLAAERGRIVEAIKVLGTQFEYVRIVNNEPLVQFLLADEYESYRKQHPDGAVEVQVKEDLIQYSSESDGMWHDSFWQSLHPEEFDEAVRRIREYGEGKK